MSLPDTSAPPVLSLCMPTYNRARFLREALSAAIAQVECLPPDQVEIVVSDNASNDETAQVIEETLAAHPRVCLRFHRQPENGGPDRNIYQAVKLARGEFVYILSDDDVLLPGAVAKLLGLMHEHPEADALALNIRSFMDSPDEESAPWFPVTEDTVHRDPAAALACFRPMQLMFLSVFAFRRALASADYSDKVGTNLLQSYLFVDVLARSRGLVVTSEPFLAQRKDNTGGWGFWRVMTTGLRDLMEYARRAGFPAPIIAALLRRHLREDLYTATRYFKLTPPRETFTPSPAAYADGIKRLLAVYGPDPFLLGTLIPLILTPSLPLRLARGLYKRRKPGMGGKLGDQALDLHPDL